MKILPLLSHGEPASSVLFAHGVLNFRQYQPHERRKRSCELKKEKESREHIQPGEIMVDKQSLRA